MTITLALPSRGTRPQGFILAGPQHGVLRGPAWLRALRGASTLRPYSQRL